MELLVALLLVGAAWILLKGIQAATANGQAQPQSAPPPGMDFQAPIDNSTAGQQSTGVGWVGDIIQFIKDQEGLKLIASRDTSSYSIGYGHDLLPGESYPNGISQAQAEQLLQQDVASAKSEVASLVKVPLSQGQQDALTDFTFNEGSGHLEKSTLLELVNQGDYAGAGEQLLRWVFADGQMSSDLKARREAELQMWNG